MKLTLYTISLLLIGAGIFGLVDVYYIFELVKPLYANLTIGEDSQELVRDTGDSILFLARYSLISLVTGIIFLALSFLGPEDE
jgi:hypothetical protein